MNLPVEAIECENDSFNELEDFGEISAIALPESNFVISSVVGGPEEHKEECEEEVDEKKEENNDKLK